MSKFVISSLRHVEDKSFENLSVSSHKWLHIDEVILWALLAVLFANAFLTVDDGDDDDEALKVTVLFGSASCWIMFISTVFVKSLESIGRWFWRALFRVGCVGHKCHSVEETWFRSLFYLFFAILKSFILVFWILKCETKSTSYRPIVYVSFGTGKLEESATILALYMLTVQSL